MSYPARGPGLPGIDGKASTSPADPAAIGAAKAGRRRGGKR